MAFMQSNTLTHIIQSRGTLLLFLITNGKRIGFALGGQTSKPFTDRDNLKLSLCPPQFENLLILKPSENGIGIGRSKHVFLNFIQRRGISCTVCYTLHKYQLAFILMERQFCSRRRGRPSLVLRFL